MHTFALTHVTDDNLLAALAALVQTDRQTTAALLAHIAEVDARQLYLPAACSSMHAYCMRVLHFSEDAAFKRIRAARVARRFPQIFDAVAQGLVHLTGLWLLAPHLTEDNVDEVLAKATHRSRAEIEVIVAALAPRPDLPTRIDPVPPPSEQAPLPQLVPEPPPPVPPPPPRAKPLAPERYGLQVTISQATRDKLERATALLRHRNPTGDVADVLDRALDALLADLEREKFGATSRPRARGARREDANPRYVSNDVRRAVHARDGAQCAFVSADGVRCTERGFLEIDHRTLVAHGGLPTEANCRMLCKAHNQYEAERLLGADFMAAKRREAKASRVRRAAAKKSAGAPASEAVANAGSMVQSAANAPIVPTDASKETPVPTDASKETPMPTDASKETSVPTAFVEQDTRAAVERDVTLALRGMGFKAEETRRAMADSAHGAPADFEGRIRAALAAFRRAQAMRCSDGPCDALSASWLAEWRCAG